MKIFSLMILFCAWHFWACGDQSESADASHSAIARGEALIAFVDISRSLSDDAFERELESLQKIFLSLTDYDTNQVEIYPLHGDLGRGIPPVVKCELFPNLYSGDYNQRAVHKQRRVEDWKKYADNIRVLRQKLMQEFPGGGPLNQTCITAAFSYIESFLASNANAKRKQLIFASDMLESCDGIKMDGTAEEFRQAEPIVLNRLQNVSLSLHGVEIKMFAPGDITGIKMLPQGITVAKLENFWKAIFSRLGATETAKINFQII